MGKQERIAVLVTIVGVALSVGGRLLSTWLGLPLWLDTLGTALVAYVVGPVPGAVAGLCSNVIFSAIARGSAWYGLASAAVGAFVGIQARRGSFRSIFGALGVGSACALVAVAVSVPLNAMLYGGYTGNVWGNGVVDLLASLGVPFWICVIAGEFYLDFLDKMLMAAVLFGMIRLHGELRRRFDARTGDGSDAKPRPQKKAGTRHVALFLLAFTLALGAAPRDVLAQTGDVDFYSYVQQTYSSDSGLPCGEANDIAQTKDGILWIGTYAGLYRYNGREFSLMDDFDSVKNVNCLFVDEEGRLWIGTNDKGLSLCVEEHVSNVIDTSDGLPSDSVRSIVQCSDGTYYVGTSDALQILELNGGITMLRQVPEIMYAHSMSADKRTHVAAVTSAGDLFVLEDGEVMIHATLAADRGEGQYTCCLFDSYGRLCVGTSEGFGHLYDISTGELRELNTYEFSGLTEINSLLITDSNLLFACADNGVAAFVPKGGYTSIHTGQFNNSIDHMMVDYQGNFWFTSSRLGVLKMTRSTFSDLYEMAGLDRKVVNSTTLWQGLLYVGTDSGLDVVDLVQGTAVENDLTSQLAGVRVRCAYVDSRDHLWVCTYGKGLLDVAPDLAVKAYDAGDAGFSDRVRTCVETPDGAILASADSCVARIADDAIQQVLPYGPGFSSSQVLCFLVQDDGTVLAGTDGDGIVALNGGEVAWKVTAEDGLSSNIILRLAEGPASGQLYAVTSNGLCLVDANHTARLLGNFPYFNNFDVQRGAAGELFVLSSAGVYVVSEDDLVGDVVPLSYDLLDAKSGLAASITANSWNCQSDDGMLYVSSDLGVFSLDTQDFAEGKRSYRMKVSSIALDGVTYHVERGTTFSIDQDATRMDIYPEVISYTLDDPYVSYQLEGYDLRPTTVRSSDLGAIGYTNVPAGDYTFRLAILAGDGSVLEEGRYALHKDAMIYENAWFQVYVVLVGGVAIAWFTWYLARSSANRRLERQQRELDLAQRQIQMADQTVLSIARAVDAKDGNTSQHSQRVSQYSVLLARELGFSDEECENLRKAALLHDIGKIGIPDRILNKPARLTDEEYTVMKTHVSRGAEILKDFTLIDHVVEGALYHHERYDGHGYVNGLAGEEIPLYGRIIAVADAFDAMTQNRVYRQKQDLGYVLGELERGKGTQFDPEIATIMLRLIDEGKIDHILNGTDEEGEEAS